MMKWIQTYKQRLLAGILLVCTLLPMLFAFPVFAAETTATAGTDPYYAGKTFDEKRKYYFTHAFATAEEKFDSMQSEYTFTSGDYEMRIEQDTGEVAVRNLLTGQILFSNPYGLAGQPITDAEKERLLSQVVLTYGANGSETSLYSYLSAASKGQISIKKMKDGLSVSYTMGKIKTRSLVPYCIESERFETLIKDKIKDPKDLRDLMVWYPVINHLDPNNTKVNSPAEIAQMQSNYPVLRKLKPAKDGEEQKLYSIYVLDAESISDKFLVELETIIRRWCPDYTFEELEYDYNLVEYTPEDASQPLFKLSVEYSLDSQGLRATLPANSIRFDESNYSLISVELLPFMGAGSNEFTGYTFLPDGSGSLVRFEDVKGTTSTIGGFRYGKVYGADYTYHDNTASNAEEVRFPVFGVVENFDGKVGLPTEIVTPPSVDGEEPTVEKIYDTAKIDRGYFAIIEKGDAVAAISSKNYNTHPYNNVYATFYPRPKDSYNLAAAGASSDSSAVWTVVSQRKYSGDCTVRYLMLLDPKVAEQSGVKNYYEPSYVGMAAAYRDYLYANGTLTRLNATEQVYPITLGKDGSRWSMNAGDSQDRAGQTVRSDIPLYIEAFGAIDTKDTFLSIPVTVKTPLTTFENVAEMYDKLEQKGVTNINFRLTGFANGGMQSTVPAKVKFVKQLGGNDGYQALLDYANQKGFGVYPEFEFSYLKLDKSFDGYNSKKDAAKTIDGRYIQAVYYDPAYQIFTKSGELVISPASFRKFVTGFNDSMQKYEGMLGVSVASLGKDLNSDFDEKDSYTREDTKLLSQDALNRLKATYGSLMSDGGNVYALPYLTHILNVSLTSSNYQAASEAVPFVGMVLHGSYFFAGSATNMASDMRVEKLRIIESGASPYFILASQNTSKLKEDSALTKYYSIDFSIWYADIVATYNEINAALRDVQTSLILGHEFLNGVRIRTEEDMAYDEANNIVDAEVLAKRYAVTDGSIVRVTYENGISFLLNYNRFAVTAGGVEIPALGFCKLGTPQDNSGM